MEKKLDELPKTKAYLQRKTETVEQFQERSILYTIRHIKEIGEGLVAWKIMREAGIKDYKKWIDFVNKHIDKKSK